MQPTQQISLFDIDAAPVAAPVFTPPAKAARPIDGKLTYIQNALNQGFGASAIASSLGVTPSAVTQIIQEHKLIAASNSQHKMLDRTYDQIEEKAAAMLNARIKSDDLNSAQLANVIHKVNALRRRSAGEGYNQQGQQALVSLTIPASLRSRAEVNVVLSPQNEIVEIDGRDITTMPSANLGVLSKKLAVDRIENLFAPALPKPIDNS